MKKVIVWFRNDLRIHDNEPLTKAISESDFVVPFFCFDKNDYGITSFGFPKTGSFRAQFQLESIADLKDSLLDLGSNLCIRLGDTASQIRELTKGDDEWLIYAEKGIHQEEIEIQKKVEEIPNVSLHYSFGSTLFHINDLPHSFENTPKVFSDFRKTLEKQSQVRPLYPDSKNLKKTEGIEWGSIPSIEDLGLKHRSIDNRAAIVPKGGETAALKRLNEYFYETKSLADYKNSRNGLIGENYSSKLSLWLWNGCLSPRKIYWEVKKFEESIHKNQSTYWLVFELIWRDFFKFIALKHGNKTFQLKGIGNKERVWKSDKELFDRWAKGKTGIPFVDANMIELNETGFMSNRGRQNVASFLTKELGIDWRMGAEYFESQLIDYDVASNYGNWMYVAGVGSDPRDRFFNMISQAKSYDPKGEYVRLWIPELREIDSKYVHHPWTAKEDLFTDTFIDYESPIVLSDYWEKYY